MHYITVTFKIVSEFKTVIVSGDMVEDFSSFITIFGQVLNNTGPTLSFEQTCHRVLQGAALRGAQFTSYLRFSGPSPHASKRAFSTLRRALL